MESPSSFLPAKGIPANTVPSVITLGTPPTPLCTNSGISLSMALSLLMHCLCTDASQLCFVVRATHSLWESCELQQRARVLAESVQRMLNVFCKAPHIKEYLHLGLHLFSERPRWMWRKHFWRWCECRIVFLCFFPMIPPHWYFFDLHPTKWV